jgi:hypothetical protein
MNGTTKTGAATTLAAATPLNTNKYDWGNELKVEIGDLSKVGGQGSTGTGTKGPITPGRYAAFLQEVKNGTFKSGSYGVTFTYIIDNGPMKNRKIREHIVLKRADGSVVEFGGARIKRRLMGFNMPLEKINAFRGPRNEHDLGDFALVLGAPVTIVVAEDGEYNGAPSRKVKAVYQRTLAE